MRFENLIMGIDSHTAGESTRILTSGIPIFPGKTMSNKIDFVRNTFDYIRTALVREPRGHDAIVIAYLQPPVEHGSDFSVIFANSVGYLGMCGHGLIGVATVLVEIGMVQKNEGITKIVFDTVVGTVEAQILIYQGRLRYVTIQNVPSFVYLEQIELDVNAIGRVIGDVVYGGNWFFFVQASQLALSIKSENINKLTKICLDIRKALEDRKLVEAVPFNNIQKHIDHIKIYESIHSHQKGSKSFVLCPGEVYDRSPCGTGLSAELALLYKRGEIMLQEDYTCESIIGSIFHGKIIKEIIVEDFQAIIPEISGSAYITGINQFVIDEDDPFKYGINL